MVIVGLVMLVFAMVVWLRHASAKGIPEWYLEGGYRVKREVTPERIRFTLSDDGWRDSRDYVVYRGHRHFGLWQKVIQKRLWFRFKQTGFPQRFTLKPVYTDYLIPEPYQFGSDEFIREEELDQYPDKPIEDHEKYMHD